jgi:hypothetical protein
MAKVSDAATTNPQSAGWFKIAQTGLITSCVSGYQIIA